MTRSFRHQIELILSLAKRDLKARYKESVLGFFWSLLKPAFLTVIIWAVFSVILRIEFPDEIIPYWLHVLVSVLAWNYFIGSITEATGSVVANGNLLKKVRLDAEVFPIASIISNLIHFLLALFIALLVIFWIIGFPRYLVFLPVMIGIETLLILGFALYLSSLNVFYRDISGLLEIVTMAWFYVTPIIYPLQTAEHKVSTALGEKWFHVYMLNPITPIVGAMRRVILYDKGQGEISSRILIFYLAIALMLSLFLVVTGWWFFRRSSDRFADEL